MNVTLPIQRPGYTTTVGVDREAWIDANQDDLERWYLQCGGGTEERITDLADFLDFANSQYDLELDFDERFTDALYESQLRDIDNEDEP